MLWHEKWLSWVEEILNKNIRASCQPALIDFMSDAL